MGRKKDCNDSISELSIEAKLEHLKAIVEDTDDAIITKTLDGIVTSWNRGAEAVYGYCAEDMIGKSITKIIPDDRLEEFEAIIRQANKGRRSRHFETVRKRKDGKLIDVSTAFSPIKDKNNKVVGISIVARDITDEKMMEKRKDDFISIAGHELKTPITTIKLMAQMITSKSQKMALADIESLGRRIDDQTKRLTKIIDDMLDLSKIQMDKMEIAKEKTDINGLVREVVEDIRNFANGRKIEVVGGAKADVEIDKYRIARVLTNLLVNAVKYSGETSKITVDVREVKKMVTVGVSDEGVGISKEETKKIFEQFYRSDHVKKRQSGMGLGLYISKEIINLHKGKIWVESELGKGSAFYFSLPITK